MSRPILLMLPGLNNTGDVFADVTPRLGDLADVRVEALPVLETVEAIAAQILERAPDRFLLCGYSFGGYVALAMLEAAPERIQALALVGSLPTADDAARLEGRRRGIEAALDGRYLELVESQTANAMHALSLTNTPLLERRRAMVAEYGAERFVAHSRAAAVRPDRTEALRTAPHLLLAAGETDALAPAPALHALADRIPGASVAIIPAAGHLAPLEQPEATADALRAWLETA